MGIVTTALSYLDGWIVIGSAASGGRLSKDLERSRNKVSGLALELACTMCGERLPGFDAEGSGFYRAGPLGACDFTHLCC